MFGRKKEDLSPVDAPPAPGETNDCLVLSPFPAFASDVIKRELGVERVLEEARENVASSSRRVRFILAAVDDNLAALFEIVHAARAGRTDGYPVLLLVISRSSFLTLGGALFIAAQSEKLSGVRLLVADSAEELYPQLREVASPVEEPTIIKMPLAPEVENSGFKYFYIFSPELRQVVKFVGELAENNQMRLYLLGAPGTGKTSLAYYYFLKRGKGNFVTVNLSAENTQEKAAMKSLLCGHVSGAIAGASAREGALSFARDGVCFLDESHGVTGSVVQVLMEVLEGGQFLPYGATAKRLLECAVVFASNRSWQALRAMMHLDEHARLGATVITIPDLRHRREDRIAVAASCLNTFKSKVTTWKAPLGFSPEAWRALDSCPWRGNTRTLIRVMEGACVAYGSRRIQDSVITSSLIEESLELWEPNDKHQDDELYVSA